MIRATPLFDTREIENLIAFLDAYPELATEAVSDALKREVIPPLLSELRHVPGPSKHPWAFATAKSRRWWFYAVRAGLVPTDGERYVRSGKLMAAWKVRISVDDDTVVLSAENKNKAIRYVTGDRQVRGHKNTGWPKHGPTIDFWAEAGREVGMKALDRLVNRR